VSLLDRLASRLARTREKLSDGLSGLFRGGRQVDSALLDEFEALLYDADLGPVAERVLREVRRCHERGEIHGEDELRAVLRATLVALLAPAEGQRSGEVEFGSRPTIVLVVGVNGSGKTTTIAKLAHRFQARGLSVLLGACDTFRAAAAEQLEIWAERNGAPLVRGAEGADPASVAFDSVESACVLGIDVALLDTAGRLHTQKNLMAELSKVARVAAKRLPGAPHEVWLVIDGTAGQNAIAQAREFAAAVPVTGLILSKLDGTARGGAVFSIQQALGLPVRYIGTGESLEALEPFVAETFVDAIVAPAAVRGT
jgi:fused signal recognition particle receptor